jgi:hypothetical protein
MGAGQQTLGTRCRSTVRTEVHQPRSMVRMCVSNGQVPLPTPSLATRGAAANLGTVVARRQSASSSGQALPTCDLVSRLEAPGRARSTRNLLNRARTRHDIACPPGAPRGMTPGGPGGQLATHATYAPVTGGVGHAFAMRRSGVRIPAAPPQRSAGDQRKCATGLARTRVCLTSVPPG